MGLGIKHTEEDKAGGPPLDIAAAIAEFYREFPRHRETTFILNHQEFASGHDAVASYAPQVAALVEKNPKARTAMASSLAAGLFAGKLPASVNISDAMYNGARDTAVYGRFVIPAGEEFSARLMKSIFVAQDAQDNDRFPVMPAKFNNTEMWQRYVLDHELGHALTISALDKQKMKTVSFGNRAECEADAYAMIRHFQRYGSSSEFPAYIRDLRNMNAVHKGDVTHWTPRAIDVVISLNEKGKLASLTPAQCVTLATVIAQQTALSADAEHHMAKAFAQTRKVTVSAIKNRTPDGDRIMSMMEKVCEIGAETQSPAVLNACRRYMPALSRYIPSRDMAMSKTPDELRAIRDNNRILKSRDIPAAEPAVTGLSRVFRDRLLDLQSGVERPKPNNDNKGGKKGPKLG